MRLSEQEKKAVKEAMRLKAAQVRDDDQEETFSDFYFHIQHEVDMFDEEQDSNELSKRNADSARRWLAKYAHLYID